jgi:hypothetical protein
MLQLTFARSKSGCELTFARSKSGCELTFARSKSGCELTFARSDGPTGRGSSPARTTTWRSMATRSWTAHADGIAPLGRSYFGVARLLES